MKMLNILVISMAIKRNKIVEKVAETILELICCLKALHPPKKVSSCNKGVVLAFQQTEFPTRNVYHPDDQNKHSAKKNSTTSHKNIPHTHNKKQKSVENMSSSNMDAIQTTANQIEFGHFDGVSKGQAFFQRNRQGIIQGYADFGDKNYKCIYCGALFWLKESIKQKLKNNQPLFTLCCQQGKIKLQMPKPTPFFLENLLDPNKGHKSVLFRENIRVYNSMFAFTSMGAKVDQSINNGSSPYIFKISGQVHHLMGSLLPPEGQSPKFAQLYIYDTHNEVMNRLDAVNCNQKNEKLDQSIVQGLIQMFDESNELVKIFRTIRDKFEEGSLASLKITLLGRQPNDNRQYEQPTCDEIGGLIVGDIGLYDSNRDIVIEFKDGGLKRVTKLNPKFMSLQYPILFPYGEDGYTTNLKWNNGCRGHESKRGRIPMRAFIAYQIQERMLQLDTLLKGGRLFQQFLVDAYAALEEDRLDYIRKNQKNLRSEVYKGIYDAISNGDNDANKIGQRVILPSSYTGSARYMLNNYQDAMAICRQYGHPDLFITFTCNVKWPEIVREFDAKPGYKPEDRPDIVSRLFKMKLDDMISYIKSGKPFGEVEAGEF
ncbi:unnamed protein product [Prunus armeniaca]